MNKTILALAAVGTLLAACDVTHPVAVVGNGTVFKGTATASMLEGGWFQATNGAISCSGRFVLTPEPKTVTFPVSCTNGLSGIGTATYTTPTQGGGDVVMQDGSKWKFIFGRQALGL
ncbi:MAG: hypothetical protein ACPG5U_00975 [Planktomarina sp.]